MKGVVIKNVRRLLLLIYICLFAWTLFLVFGLQSVLRVFTAKDFPLENTGYFMIGGLGAALLLVLNARCGRKNEGFLCRYRTPLLSLSLVFLLFWQLYTCYGGYFLSGWDAGTIRCDVGNQLNRHYEALDHVYFSWFPNNMFLVWVFTSAARAAALFGFFNWEYVLAAFQCILDVFAIWLVYKVAFDFAGSQRLAFLVYFTAYLFVGLSPWFIVPYSDAAGLLFPILTIRLFQLYNRPGRPVTTVLWCVLTGFVSIAGFFIKPQVFIAFLAVVLIEVCLLPGKGWQSRLPALLRKMLGFTAGIAVFLFFYHGLILPSLHYQRDTDSTIGWQHYLMMGLNRSRDGAYSAEDHDFTRSFATNEERNSADLREAKRRLKEMGLGGLIRHLNRKQLVNYGDGTFGWNGEGNFFAGDPDWARNGISSFIRSLIRPEGHNYNRFLASRQLIWVMVLFFQPFACLYRSGELSSDSNLTFLVMAASITGLTVFELLFEARARYLFCYAPVFVILSGWGLRNVYCLIRRHFRFGPVLRARQTSGRCAGQGKRR